MLPHVSSMIPAVALWVYGVVFMVNGFFSLGKADPKGTGVVSMAGGTINLVFAFVLAGACLIGFYMGVLAEPVAIVGIVTALLIFHFGILCWSVGPALVWGLDLKAAVASIFFIAPFLVVFGAFFLINHMYWFACNAVLWALVVSLFGLVVHGKLNPKIAGWVWILESVGTCFVPATILFLGYTLH
jgi:hypothetical protein